MFLPLNSLAFQITQVIFDTGALPRSGSLR
jgi:hypothetical protein